MIKPILICLLALFVFFGCENTNPYLAIDAGLDALKAVTLSDGDVKMLAAEASKQSDSKNRIAGLGDPYGNRLKKLVGDRYDSDGYAFDFKVYLSPQVNAFAMADGTIRIYSRLMDMMSDEELLFVVGHEIGHVVERHIRKKIMLAYAANAVRKGIASQESLVGGLARSAMGGFVQTLVNARFSQAEEKEADDFGLAFIKKHGLDARSAVSALQKLDTLGKSHSFLSSHPDPALRAQRLQDRINHPDQATAPSFIDRIIDWIMARIRGFFS